MGGKWGNGTRRGVNSLRVGLRRLRRCCRRECHAPLRARAHTDRGSSGAAQRSHRVGCGIAIPRQRPCHPCAIPGRRLTDGNGFDRDAYNVHAHLAWSSACRADALYLYGAVYTVPTSERGLKSE